jgi:hypothetical protein
MTALRVVEVVFGLIVSLLEKQAQYERERERERERETILQCAGKCKRKTHFCRFFSEPVFIYYNVDYVRNIVKRIRKKTKAAAYYYQRQSSINRQMA